MAMRKTGSRRIVVDDVGFSLACPASVARLGRQHWLYGDPSSRKPLRPGLVRPFRTSPPESSAEMGLASCFGGPVTGCFSDPASGRGGVAAG